MAGPKRVTEKQLAAPPRSPRQPHQRPTSTSQASSYPTTRAAGEAFYETNPFFRAARGSRSAAQRSTSTSPASSTPTTKAERGQIAKQTHFPELPGTTTAQPLVNGVATYSAPLALQHREVTQYPGAFAV